MFIRHLRLAVVVVVAAGAVAIPVAAIGYSSSPTAPSPTTTKSSIDQTSDEFTALAASAGISETRLQQGLAAAKRAGGNSAAGVSAFASAAGVSAATAQHVVTTVFGAHEDHSLTGPSAVAALASKLGVSTAAAQSALQRIGELSGHESRTVVHHQAADRPQTFPLSVSARLRTRNEGRTPPRENIR